jgi:Arabinose-binding domain of AraC transcription regulator, N-term
MTQRMVPASGPMLLLGYGVSRGLSLDTLCGLIDYAPHQLADPSRMVPFETSLSLWHALIECLPDENIGVGLGSFARLEHAGMFWAFLKYLSNPLEVLHGLRRFAPFGDSSCIDDPVTILELEDRIELRYPKALKYGIPERVEALNVAILGVLSRVAGKPIPARVIRAAHKVCPKRRLAEQAYGCTVLYDCADDVLCFDRSVQERLQRRHRAQRHPDSRRRAVLRGRCQRERRAHPA